ncbi:MAG: CBS domain-containing protein [Proteobacteria bacterium]|nr:CBS domain-containing protein [Pseudomonadota bacterium]
MRKGPDVPRVGPEQRLAQGLLEMSRKGLGMTTVVSEDGVLLGVFTDGDLRRALDRNVDVHRTLMREVMTVQGKSVRPDTMAAEAVNLMQAHRITQLVVVDDANRVCGAINVHDLMRAGIV